MGAVGGGGDGELGVEGSNKEANGFCEVSSGSAGSFANSSRLKQNPSSFFFRLFCTCIGKNVLRNDTYFETAIDRKTFLALWQKIIINVIASSYRRREKEGIK